MKHELYEKWQRGDIYRYAHILLLVKELAYNKERKQDPPTTIKEPHPEPKWPVIHYADPTNPDRVGRGITY